METQDSNLSCKTEKLKDLKYANQRALLSCLQSSDELSVSEIAKRIRLSKTTVAQMLYSLIDKKIVLSAGKGSSTREGGKKPVLFRFNADHMYTFSISMYYNIIDLAILNLNSVIRYRLCDPAKKFSTYEELVALMAEQIQEAMKLYGISSEKIYSISISADGIIDAKNGIVRYPMHHDWPRDMHLLEDLSAKLPFGPKALFLDSPIAFMGYAELLSPEIAGLDKLLCLFAGEAASGCVISNRELLHGANGFIGEFGHIILDPNSDIRCACGGYGCFETLVSTSRLLSAAKESSGNRSLSLATLFDDYKKGEPYALKHINEIIKVFSIMIHNLILTHDPDKVILQGPYSFAGGSFIQGIKEQINDLPFYKVKRDIDIEFARISPAEAIHIGAAYHSFNSFLREFHVSG